MATNVYIIDMDDNPLMPCHDGGFVRRVLKEKRAEVVRRKPFTIQLKYAIRNKYTQEITLGVDSGYRYIGFSASTDSAEIFSAELEDERIRKNRER